MKVYILLAHTFQIQEAMSTMGYDDRKHYTTDEILVLFMSISAVAPAI
ncbi:hypothetical protein [Nostoc sp. DSM 114159]